MDIADELDPLGHSLIVIATFYLVLASGSPIFRGIAHGVTLSNPKLSNA